MARNAVRVILGVVVAGALVMGVKTMVFGAVRKEQLPAPVLDEQIPRRSMRRRCLRADVSGAYRRHSSDQGRDGEDGRLLGRPAETAILSGLVGEDGACGDGEGGL